MKQISRTQFEKAVAALKRGGVVLLPSESVYGLYTPVRSGKGVQRILKLKQRRDAKFTAVAASLAQVHKFFPTTRQPLRKFRKSLPGQKDEWIRVARTVWPGPVSLVVSPRLSVRVPDMPLLRQLVRRVGQPLIATSANLAGGASTFSVAEVASQLDLEQLDAVVDAGRLPKRPPSAVVKLTSSGIKVLRPGPARVNRILAKLV